MTEPDPRMSEDLKLLLQTHDYPDGMYMFWPELFQVKDGKVITYNNPSREEEE